MKKEDVPNLQLLIVNLAKEMSKLYPEVFTVERITRLQEASNILLVLSRVLASIAKSFGLSDEALQRAIKNSKHIEDQPLFAVASSEPCVTGRMTDWDVMAVVDSCLFKPSTRQNMPKWFVEEYWPQVLRRAAQGDSLSDRERAIALHLSSLARGER